jgi:large subunit ribosomal protein L9
MKVVFLEEVEGTAHTGDVKNVANGFARNFLLPRKLAAPATDHYITIAQAKAGKEAKRQERLDDEARDRLLPIVDGKSVSIEVRVGEQGKLFGSVTARDIAELLQDATRIELEHRQVDLREPIRELGAHEVTVKLTRNVLATITVNVEPLGGLPVAETAGEAIEGLEDEAEPVAESPLEDEIEAVEESGAEETPEEPVIEEATDEPPPEESAEVAEEAAEEVSEGDSPGREPEGDSKES